jgi:hypothetical protein
LEEELWLASKPSPPLIMSILDENKILLQMLNLEMWLAVGCNL